MEETLLALLTAHFLADFVFQTHQMVQRKNEWAILLLHIGIVALSSFALLGNFHLLLLLGICGSHLLFDRIKVCLANDNWQNFVIDQIAHLVALVTLSYFYADVAGEGWWRQVFDASWLPWFYAAQCFCSGICVVAIGGGILIEKLTAPIGNEIAESRILSRSSDEAINPPADSLGEGLHHGGMHIGWLERFLTLMLILIGHPTGIGFLIAAKSILRFGEIKESRHRKLAEYIIIGTFLSFGWALLMSVATMKAIEHWLPPAGSEAAPVKVIIEQVPMPPARANPPVSEDGDSDSSISTQPEASKSSQEADLLRPSLEMESNKEGAPCD